ncbi:hypothetical protein SAMN05428989_1835 [Pseudoxanthomonas sp. GM95]|uniref:hypothetical protein n=1 Tax=Pseudoxanthomonas sp. GM95 TaxID=1881043 RepID=UPI0008C982F8|nr:hypothetical protein [Pseudoxanthomonas sp. GM95]SEL52085.1 hypothetical protein SAMN05428989_1835 [Pseudoxanthomonas sp. GM95]
MRIYRVAIYVHRDGQRTMLYVGQAIVSYGQPWLVLEWENEEIGIPRKRLPLDPDLLLKQPPLEEGVEADWSYNVDMKPLRKLH